MGSRYLSASVGRNVDSHGIYTHTTLAVLHTEEISPLSQIVLYFVALSCFSQVSHCISPWFLKSY